MERISFLVGKNDIGKTVFIHIHEPQAIVAAQSIYDRGIWRQRVAEPIPALVLFRPPEDSVLGFVANEQLAQAIAIQVAKAHATIHQSLA